MSPDLLPREAPATFRERRDPGYWLRDAPHTPLVAFSTRHGGASRGPYATLNLGATVGDDPEAVRRNRDRLLSALGARDCARLRQVHGARIVEPLHAGEAGEGDVLATRRPDLALAVSIADCLPIVLWDEGRTALAVVHAGWRGIVAGALEAAAEWLRARTGTATLRAALGPGIRGCCFEVGDDVAAHFPPRVMHQGPAKRHVDLAAAARERLASAGLAPTAIEDVSQCTACDPGRYFSHRRDRGRTGRHWALARLEPASS